MQNQSKIWTKSGPLLPSTPPKSVPIGEEATKGLENFTSALDKILNGKLDDPGQERTVFEDTLEQLQAQTRRHVQLLCLRRNSSQPFYRLPRELMSEIFYEVIADRDRMLTYTQPSFDDYRLDCLIARGILVSVSTLWRAVVEEDPQFWCFVTRARPMALLAKDIQQARGRPLDMTAIGRYWSSDFKDPSTEARFWALFPFNQCGAICTALYAGFVQGLAEGSKVLQSITVRGKEGMGVETENKLQLPDPHLLPALHILSLSDVTLAKGGLPNYRLISLHLHSVRRCSVRDVLNVLERSPDLEDLGIEGWTARPDPDVFQRPIICLSQLSTCVLEDIRSDVICGVLNLMETTLLDGFYVNPRDVLNAGEIREHVWGSVRQMLTDATSDIELRLEDDKVTLLSEGSFEVAGVDLADTKALVLSICGAAIKLEVNAGSDKSKMAARLTRLEGLYIHSIKVSSELLSLLLAWWSESPSRGSDVETLLIDGWEEPSPEACQAVQRWKGQRPVTPPRLKRLLYFSEVEDPAAETVMRLMADGLPGCSVARVTPDTNFPDPMPTRRTVVVRL